MYDQTGRDEMDNRLDRERAAASYFRTHRREGLSYTDVCRQFSVPSFDIQLDQLTRTERIVRFLENEGEIVVLLMALAVIFGGYLLARLIWPGYFA